MERLWPESEFRAAMRLFNHLLFDGNARRKMPKSKTRAMGLSAIAAICSTSSWRRRK
jgi:hypothetical protein